MAGYSVYEPTRLETTVHWEMVREFMQRARQATRLDPELDPDAPTFPTFDERCRAATLILEEAGELVGGLGFALEYNLSESVEGVDVAEAVDGVFDLQVVATCVLVMLGVPDARLRYLIDSNNLEKFGPGHSIREDGKLVKPDNHKPVDVIGELAKMTRGDS